MNTATKSLEEDHIYVLKLTDVMEKITRSDSVDVGHIAEIIDTIKNFADGLHHTKEENIFFPALEKKGFSAQQGPVAVMLNEHVQGRKYVKGISDNLELFRNGDESARNGIFRNMIGYAELLRSHIGKENNILFRMADKVLNEEEQKNLLEQFAVVEVNLPEGAKANDYIEKIRRLASFYNV